MCTPAAPHHWKSLCKALEREDLIDDPRFATPSARSAAGQELLQILKTALEARPAREWERLITDAGGASGMVYQVEDVISDPQAMANGFFEEYETPAGPRRLLTPPMQYSRTPLRPRGRAPELGQHTDAVLSESGYSSDEISGLREAGTI